MPAPHATQTSVRSDQLERRGSLRLSVGISIRVRLCKSHLPGRYARLLNLSETGAFFTTWQKFREGDVLELSTTIETVDWTNSLEWRHLARVVRIQEFGSRTLGVAVTFERESANLNHSRPAASKRSFSSASRRRISA